MRRRYLAFKQMHDFLVDIWDLYREYAVSDFTDEEAAVFHGQVQKLRAKYDNAFTSEVLVALCCEIGRIMNDKKKGGN